MELPDYVTESDNPEFEAYLYEAYEATFRGNDTGSSDVTASFGYCYR